MKFLLIFAAVSTLAGCPANVSEFKPLTDASDAEVCQSFARQHWRKSWSDEAILQVKKYNAKLTVICGPDMAQKITNAMITGAPAP